MINIVISNNMKIAFLFAGQGAQIVHMGEDFYSSIKSVKNLYDSFPEIKSLCFEDKDSLLNQTAYAQKAMLLTSYSIANSLREEGINPEYVCGLSLGEYTALTFSDTWSIIDAIDIISNRGKIMQEALPLNTTKMAAVINLDRETIKECLNKVTSGVVEIANYNCPSQIVITGENQAVDDAIVLLKEKTKRVIPLNVSGAFHCSLLNDASIKLREVLNRYRPNKPKYKVVYNISGKEEDRDINDILQEQICHSVYFEDTIRYLYSKGVDNYIEIGPGKTLSSFVKKTIISDDIKIYNVSDLVSYQQVINELR